MIDKTFAEHFAQQWIDAWNSHDLDRILGHYSDQFEMSSPVIIQITGEPTGTLKGKHAVGGYWAKALQLIPDLRFELLALLTGVNSITLYYKGARGRLAAEVFHFGSDQKVLRAYAHYAV
ncbi:MAG: nuclear transport factor 2 family protein [Gammaproteobacteria bacterium]|nr:nuclear transport factor 2 family protein [Gammaproteobacteria bacterium]